MTRTLALLAVVAGVALSSVRAQEAPPAGGLTPADEAQIKRFAESDWYEATITAGSKTYYLTKTSRAVSYSISQGGALLAESQIELSQLLGKEGRAASRVAAQPIVSATEGGTIQPLRAYRYEIVELPTGRRMIERMEYSAEELEKAREADIVYYEALYQQNMPKVGENESPAPPRVYAEWYYAWRQLLLWEQYNQRLLKRDIASKLPEDPMELPTVYPNIEKEYEAERDAVGQGELDILLALYENIRAREESRNRYKLEQKERMVDVSKYADDWSSLDRGDSAVIDGVTYIRSEEPLRSVPAQSVNIVSPVISPYDILAEDGSLKKPETIKRRPR